MPPTIAIAADTFERERVGVVFGWIFASHQLGAAFAAWAAGATRGWFGSYGPAFIAVGGHSSTGLRREPALSQETLRRYSESRLNRKE